MSENFANEYATTLNGAINNSVTSLVVTTATSAPAADFRIKIDDELMLVTAKAGTTYTVTRGVEGTTAASHADLAPVTHVLTAESITRIRRPTGRAYNTATQNVSSGGAGSGINPTFNSEEWDDLAMHSTSSNTDRFTATVAGVYHFTGQVFWQANSTNIRYACFTKNGTDIIGSGDRTLSPGSTGGISVRPECMVSLAVGDIVRLYVEQNSGSTLTIGHASITPIQTMVEYEFMG
jgi:hypothetical protein